MRAILAEGLATAASLVFPAAALAGTPGVPTSTVKGFDAGTARYCVTDYAPNRSVTVRNARTGASRSIRTDHHGSGCTHVPVEVDCGEVSTQTIVATGVGADGNPATSSARAAVPGDAPPCGPGGGGQASGGDSGSLSTVDVALIAAGGAALLGLGAYGGVRLRGRRGAAGE